MILLNKMIEDNTNPPKAMCITRSETNEIKEKSHILNQTPVEDTQNKMTFDYARWCL